jgi:hypothetical protein
MSEAPWEIEPNGSTMKATAPWVGFSYWRGTIAPVGDNDYFSFNYPGGNMALTIETHDVGNANACSFDTKIHLLKSNGQEVANDDDDGIFPCSKLNKALDPALNNLAAGTYYIWVQHYDGTGTIPAYEVSLTIQ